MPTEWPAQMVMPVITTKSANALQLKVSGPATSATRVSVPVQIDLDGTQKTFPSTASLSGLERMRPVERVRGVAKVMTTSEDVSRNKRLRRQAKTPI